VSLLVGLRSGNARDHLHVEIRAFLLERGIVFAKSPIRLREAILEVERIVSSDAACLRLQKIPGIGPLVATTIVASIGNGAAFHKGREFAAWMGLVPKQYSTGGNHLHPACDNAIGITACYSRAGGEVEESNEIGIELLERESF